MNDLWSRETDTPHVDKVNPYTTNQTVHADKSVTFMSTRALDTGLPNSYVIEPDKDITMCFAFSKKGWQLHNHGNDRGVYTMRLNSDRTTQVLFSQAKYIKWHAWIMLYCWTVACLLEVFSNRYWKHFYSVHQWIHSIVGYVTFILTTYAIWIAYKQRNRTIIWGYHPIAGFITYIIGGLVILLGMISMFKRKFIRKDWETSKLIWWASVHRIVAYLLIFVSQVTLIAGFYIFYKQLMETTRGYALAALNFVVFWGSLAGGEIWHRKRLAREDPFTKVQETMTEKEFNDLVERGRKLVILDEFVLDVYDYIDWHPGGKFLLSHNIGRDVSKFFHGGYSLENNLGSRPAPGYKHSNLARQVVNKLIIAQFQKERIVQSTLCHLVENESHLLNKTTKVLYLHSLNSESVPNFKAFYPGLSSLGKHFLVRTLTGNKPARHYTVCNVMQP